MTDDMTNQLADIEMAVEVMGHSPSQQMRLSEITRVLQEVRRFCDTHQLTVGGSPTPKLDSPPRPEVFAHPEAAEILRRFHELWGLVETPVLTSGVDLSRRSDWRELLETMRGLGTSALWLTFYGVETVHDRAVQLRGAYRAALDAIALTRQAGMRAGCNLMVTTESIPQLGEIVGDLQRPGIQEIIPCLTDFLPTARERHNERIRPTWPEVEMLLHTLDTIPETANWRRFWHELPHKHTEAWYVQQVRGHLANRTRSAGDLAGVPSTLDVFRGIPGHAGRSLGNLRRDGVEMVLSRAIASGPCSSAAPVMMPGPRMLRNFFKALNIGALPYPLTS